MLCIVVCICWRKTTHNNLLSLSPSYPTSSLLLLHTGLQRIHRPRDEPAEGTVSYATRLTQRDRANGGNHPSQVQHYPDAAEAEHVWSCHDPSLQVPGCQVGSFSCLLLETYSDVRKSIFCLFLTVNPCTCLALSGGNEETSASRQRRFWMNIFMPTWQTHTPVRRPRRSSPRSVPSLCLRSGRQRHAGTGKKIWIVHSIGRG